MKVLIHVLCIILLALVTFFGVGPVLFSDGVLQERLWTAAIVVVIYIVLVFFYLRAIRLANK